MATGDRKDPYRSFNFRVVIDKVTSYFSECSGLTGDGDHVEYREGTDKPLTVRKLTGLRKYSNITLKRGYTTNNDLWQWYATVANGKAERRDVLIHLLDEAGNDVMYWVAKDAWINKIEGPAFKASGNEVAIESVEIIHEGLTLQISPKTP